MSWRNANFAHAVEKKWLKGLNDAIPRQTCFVWERGMLMFSFALWLILTHSFLMCVCVTDEGQTVCGSPADMQGRRLGEVGIQLRTLCHQTLGSWDYLFFVVIGFVIFAAGTVSAWVMGVIMVLYERYIKKKDEQLDPDDEEESSETGRTSQARSDHGNGNLKTSHTV